MHANTGLHVHTGTCLGSADSDAVLLLLGFIGRTFFSSDSYELLTVRSGPVEVPIGGVVEGPVHGRA